jgi:hypothetical protein
MRRSSGVGLGLGIVLAGPEAARAHHPQGDGWTPSLLIFLVAAITFAAVWLLAGLRAKRESPAADEEPTRPPEDRGEC